MAHIKRLDEIFPIYRSKRKYRDVFFRTLFGEDKKALLELYNALNGTDLNNPDDLTDFDKKKYERCQREEGREEGFAKGREEGIKEGQKETRLEMQTEMICILRKIGKSPEEISELTGLELDYVMKLAEK